MSTGLYNILAKKYNTLDYVVKMERSMKELFPSINTSSLSKYELQKLINQLLKSNYHGEEILKYYLFKYFINQKDVIGAFELNVGKSRLDFAAINGSSTSFEIKSELDNLSKLKKQSSDYLLAFEYNYLLVDAKHINKLDKIIPKSFGVLCYHQGEIKKIRKSSLNDKIDPLVQLKLLSKTELEINFPEFITIFEIIENVDQERINNTFKKILKERYTRRWQFLASHQKEIFPMDVQFFFNKNIAPIDIYQS